MSYAYPLMWGTLCTSAANQSARFSSLPYDEPCRNLAQIVVDSGNSFRKGFRVSFVVPKTAERGYQNGKSNQNR